MAKRASSTALRNIHSATEKSAVGLFRWATTDHSGISNTLANMPSMGLLDTLRYILSHFFIAVFGAVLTGAWVFFLIGYGIPFLLTGHF